MAVATRAKQSLTNHIVLVLDESASMSYRKDQLVKVIDGLVSNLAQQISPGGVHYGQDTRVTVYAFSDADKIHCIYYDKNVLSPELTIGAHYKPDGWTALNDATLKAVEDGRKHPELYGDHAHLVFVLTDGKENVSRARVEAVKAVLDRLPDNWTMCALVPEAEHRQDWLGRKYNDTSDGKRWARAAGFHDGNVMEWDTTSAKGIVDVGVAVANATTTYMSARSTGVRSMTGLFTTQNLSAENLAANGAERLTDGFQLVTAVGTPEKMKTEDFVGLPRSQKGLGLEYRNGMLYYQLIKREKIQGHKRLAAMNKKTKEIFVGTDAIRNLVGLGYGEQSVAPDFNKDWTLFVQSTAPNRHVVEHQQFILMGV